MADPAGLEGALAALPEAKRELARLMLAARQPVPAHPAPRSGAGPVPPTALQSRLWRRERTHPAVATGSHALRLTGPLDPQRLVAALTGVLRRHEALRTRLTVSTTGQPRLHVDEEPVLRLTRSDLSGFTPQAAADRVALQSAESASTVLDLESGRTSAFRLLRLAPDEHVLILASHLAVFDGWSSGVFLADLAAGYRAGGVRAGRPRPSSSSPTTPTGSTGGSPDPTAPPNSPAAGPPSPPTRPHPGRPADSNAATCPYGSPAGRPAPGWNWARPREPPRS